jgi:transposase InsO family protein
MGEVVIGEANGIEHRLTKPKHLWTNGQVERMNRTIKDGTVKWFHYENYDQLRTHLANFLAGPSSATRGVAFLSHQVTSQYEWLQRSHGHIANS